MSDTSPTSAGAKLTLLYDGLCPMCKVEMSILRRRDRKDRLAFVDIAAPDFDPAAFGLTIEQLIGSMHARTPDGTIIRGPDVFIAAYRAVGWNALAAFLAFKPTRPIVDLAYGVFAWVRPKFSGFDPKVCENGRCGITSPDRPAAAATRTA